MPGFSNNTSRTIAIATLVAVALLLVIRIPGPSRILLAYAAVGYVMYTRLEDLGGGSKLDQWVGLLAGSFMVVCFAFLLLGAIGLVLGKLGLQVTLL